VGLGHSGEAGGRLPAAAGDRADGECAQSTQCTRRGRTAPRIIVLRSLIMDMNSVLILMLISFIIGMVMGISLVRPSRSV
jgi:hypothetical protein